MLRTKFKYENKQRAITQKLSKQELRFMCTALPLDEIYPPTKFHNHTRASDLRCARTIDARFQENGARLFMVMRPSGASSLVVNKS